MQNHLVRKWVQGIALGTAGAVIAIIIWNCAGLEKWENISWDWRMSFFLNQEQASDDIVVILLDQNSLDWAQEVLGITWPWPREIYSSITDFCSRSGSKALGFDVLYTEPSAYGVRDDLSFSNALAEFKSIAGMIFLSHNFGKTTAWPESLREPGFNITGLSSLLKMSESGGSVFKYATLPVEGIAGNFFVLCNSTILPDPDSIYRKIPFFSIFDNKIVPTLGLGVYLAAHPGAAVNVNDDMIRIDGKNIPIDRKGHSILRYKGKSGAYRSYSAASVIQSELRIRQGQEPVVNGPELFKDKYVFFGFSAPGLFDHHPTPIDNSFPGVEIHATWLDNFLENGFMQKTTDILNYGFILGLCIISAFLIFLFPGPAHGAGISVFFLSVPVLAGGIAYCRGFWIPVVLPDISLGLTMTCGFIINYATEGRTKRFIKNAFKQYLSPDVIEQLILHPEKLKLGGERRELSIFFSDIQGFTSISERLDPEGLTRFLNDYLSEMTDIIQQEGGTIDKYEGDAVIAFWNAPLEVADHAVKSVRAALKCQDRLSEMRAGFRERTGSDIFARIGINTGTVIVGNMGSKNRFDFTVIGDAVNLASRLEGVNKIFGTDIIISESTQKMLGNEFAWRTLGKIQVKGRKEPVMIYEPFFHESYANHRYSLEIFSKGLESFHKGDFKDALDFFSIIKEIDPAALAYIRRLQKIIGSRDEKGNKDVWEITEK
ncbi:MAG: hypothetical protein A2277_07070 [Desulfobacterales bacterium RIFOXYA12_FULL_46_15]|nr:MAG: hypothetical protein A2277_07070 [Desulfobacterales bacterium RIFOXYA12_FULL_46_15]